MESIISCSQLEDAVEEERQLLSSVEVDVDDVESFKSQLKGFWCKILLYAHFKTSISWDRLQQSRSTDVSYLCA